MIKLKKELINKIVELNNLEMYIATFYDEKKEVDYINYRNEVKQELRELNNDFTPRDIIEIFGAIGIIEVAENYYIYNKEDIIYTLFPDNTTKNNYIISAYTWINDKDKILWIVNNVLCVASNKKYYDYVDTINNNFILSTIELNSNI